MSGLSETSGLANGAGLQSQTQIGTAGLDIQTGPVVLPDVLASDGSFVLSSDANNIVTRR